MIFTLPTSDSHLGVLLHATTCYHELGNLSEKKTLVLDTFYSQRGVTQSRA